MHGAKMAATLAARRSLLPSSACACNMHGSLEAKLNLGLEAVSLLAPIGAQGVTLSVCLSVCPSVQDKVLILLISCSYLKHTSSRLHDDFMMSSG